MNKKALVLSFLLIAGLTSCEEKLHADDLLIFSDQDKFPGEKIQEKINNIRDTNNGKYKLVDGIYSFESNSYYFDNVEKKDCVQKLNFIGDLTFDSPEIIAKPKSFVMEREVSIFDDNGTIYKNYVEKYKFKDNKYLVESNDITLDQKYVGKINIDFSIENEINNFDYNRDFKDGKDKYAFADINFVSTLLNFVFIYNGTSDFDIKETKIYLDSTNYQNCKSVDMIQKQDMLPSDKNHFINNSSYSVLSQDFSSTVLNSLTVDIEENSKIYSSMNLNLNLGGKLYEENL